MGFRAVGQIDLLFQAVFNTNSPACHERAQRVPVEAAGIEPVSDSATNDNIACGCENCQQCRAALALHSECFKRQFMASLDVELQIVIRGWGRLQDSIRSGIVTLVDFNRPNKSYGN